MTANGTLMCTVDLFAGAMDSAEDALTLAFANTLKNIFADCKCVLIIACSLVSTSEKEHIVVKYSVTGDARTIFSLNPPSSALVGEQMEAELAGLNASVRIISAVDVSDLILIKSSMALHLPARALTHLSVDVRLACSLQRTTTSSAFDGMAEENAATLDHLRFGHWMFTVASLAAFVW